MFIVSVRYNRYLFKANKIIIISIRYIINFNFDMLHFRKLYINYTIRLNYLMYISNSIFLKCIFINTKNK